MRRRGGVLGLVAIPFASGGVGGCSSAGPVSDPIASVMASVKRRRPTVVIEPPEGWQLHYLSERVVGSIMRVIWFAHPGDEEESIAADFLEGDALRRYSNHVKFDPYTGKLDVEAYTSVWVSQEGVRQYPDTEFPGSRYLGGELAAGASFTHKTDKGASHACQWWTVWHDDTRWDLELRPASDASVIAPELIATLDTTTWADVPPSFGCSPTLSSDINC